MVSLRRRYGTKERLEGGELSKGIVNLNGI
jgi:hypothetical protein